MKKIILAFIFSLFLFILLPSQIHSAETVFYPTQDTYVDQNYPALSSENEPDMMVSYNQTAHKQSIVLINFPFVMPKNAKLTKATLQLTTRGASGTSVPENLFVMKILDPWSENATWNNKPHIRMGYGNGTVDTFQRTVTFDVTTLVKEWISSPIPTTGLAVTIDDDPEPRTYDRLFASSEVANAKPKLTITYDVISPTPLLRISLKPNSFVIGPLNLPAASAESTGPAISDIQVSNISYSQASVSWKTDKNASSWVFYGNAKNGDQFNLQTGQSDAATAHSVTLSSLEQDTKYSFKVMSKDANNNETFGDISYFTTAAESTPQDSTPDAGSAQIASADGTIVENVQDTVKNKVADYTIQSSLEKNNIANQKPGTDTAVDSQKLDTATLMGLLAKQLGINKLAIILMVVMGIMALVIIFLVYKTTRKVHHHIKKHLKKGHDERDEDIDDEE